MRGYTNVSGQDPSDRYLTDRVATASPAELIGMLFDAGTKALHVASNPALDDHAFSRQLLRAQDVVMELRCSLNPEGGEMAANLDSLYAYMFRLLVDANVRRDRAKAAAVLALLKPLQEAWREACLTVVPAVAS
jgi:flagellar protein FliS